MPELPIRLRAPRAVAASAANPSPPAAVENTNINNDDTAPTVSPGASGANEEIGGPAPAPAPAEPTGEANETAEGTSNNENANTTTNPSTNASEGSASAAALQLPADYHNRTALARKHWRRNQKKWQRKEEERVAAAAKVPVAVAVAVVAGGGAMLLANGGSVALPIRTRAFGGALSGPRPVPAPRSGRRRLCIRCLENVVAGTACPVDAGIEAERIGHLFEPAPDKPKITRWRR